MDLRCLLPVYLSLAVTLSQATEYDLGNTEIPLTTNFLNARGGCNQELDEDGREFSSPNFPLYYPNYAFCKYLIKAPPGQRIQLYFDNFRLESAPNCYYDALKVFDGSDTSNPKHTFCGNQESFNVTSDGNELLLHFTSDGSVTFSGFRAHVIFLDTEESPLTTEYDLGNTEIPLTTNFLNARGGCNQVLDEDGREFSSPNFPLYYPNYAFCKYLIKAPPGQRIQLYFDNFRLESAPNCYYDALKVFDGSDTSNPKHTFCGNQESFNVTSDGNELLLHFTSDGSVTFSGFRAHVIFLDTEESPLTTEYDLGNTEIPLTTNFLNGEGCNQVLDEDGAEFSSPNFPSSYPNYAFCQYLIRAPPGQRIQLYFDNFRLESAPNCYFDALKVFDGSDTSNPKHTFCGNQESFNVTSDGNELLLHFTSDGSITSSGFKAHVIFLDTEESPLTTEYNLGNTEILLTSIFGKGCDQVLDEDGAEFSSPNFPSYYPNNAFCEYLIRAPLGQRIQLYFDNFRLEFQHNCYYDALKVFNGSDTTNPKHTFCGDQEPFEVTSDGNELLVRFTSDVSITFSGFRAHITFLESEESPLTTEYNLGITEFPLTNIFGKGCDQVLDQDAAEFSSPNSPFSYPNYAACEYLVRAPPGQRIRVYFYQFNLEYHSNCLFDAVEVYDRRVDTTHAINVLCGDLEPFEVMGTGNELFLIFRSDGSVTGSGFKAKVSFVITQESPSKSDYVNIDCGSGLESDYVNIDYRSGLESDYGITDTPQFSDYESGHESDFVIIDYGSWHGCDQVLDQDAAEFSSPNSPFSYPNYAACEYLVRAPPGQRIQVYFYQFSLEYHSNCHFDAVEVYDRRVDTTHAINVLCGDLEPFEVMGTGNELFLIFRSDGSVTRSGFKAKVSFVITQESPSESDYVNIDYRSGLESDYGITDTPQFSDYESGHGLSSYLRWWRHNDEIQDSEHETTNIPQVTEFDYVTMDVCNEGWSWHAGSMYCFFEEERTWVEASTTCASMGSRLLQVDSDEENRFIYQSLGGTGQDSIWLGLTDETDEGVWVTDGNHTAAGYTNWMRGEPNNHHNEDCAQMYLTRGQNKQPGNWNDYPCCTELSFVCEFKLSF